MAGTFGSGIKSIQRGSLTLDANPDTVTITAVVMAKSFVIIDSSTAVDGTTMLNRCVLTNTTTLTFDCVDASNRANKVSWQVIEYY